MGGASKSRSTQQESSFLTRSVVAVTIASVIGFLLQPRKVMKAIVRGFTNYSAQVGIALLGFGVVMMAVSITKQLFCTTASRRS